MIEGPQRDPRLTLRGMQTSVDEWMAQWKEGYWPPLVNLARLVEEVGELSRELNHLHGPKRKKPSEAARDPQEAVSEELADILFVVVALANSEGVDLERAFRAMMEKVRIRDADRWERIEGGQE
jgi:NTP pyrophosphatase (non-canonical NTP hydrolase)